MTEIKSLAKTTMTDLHAAFVDAFSEYAVDMQMPISQFEEMLTTRSFSADHSLGYFKGETLVGFIFVGCRERVGQQDWYDLSTGVLRDHQSEGVGKALMKALMSNIGREKVNGFVLEVLQDNTPAIAMYKSFGFQVTRRLNCYGAQRESVTTEVASLYEVDLSAQTVSRQIEAEFNGFAPSWQNTMASWENTRDAHRVVTLTCDGKLAAYGIVHHTLGRVLQVGCHTSHDMAAVAPVIIPYLAQATTAEQLMFLNVEAGNELETIIKELGFTSLLDQFEMKFSPPQ